MKKTVLLLMTLGLFISCSKNNDEDSFSFDEYPQNWQLVKMSGQIPNSETAGPEMEWQESYLLNEDGSFSKSRERNNTIIEVYGTFVMEDLSDGKYLKLIHELDNSIIGNCISNSKVETLWIKSETQITGTWNACDGPGLEYKRIE